MRNFGAIVFVALFMVIPQGAPDTGFQLIGAGIVCLIVAAPSLVAAGPEPGLELRNEPDATRAQVLRFGVSAASYLAIIVAGILLLSSSSAAFTLLLITTVVILVVSLRDTWDLLVTVADVTQ